MMAMMHSYMIAYTGLLGKHGERPTDISRTRMRTITEAAERPERNLLAVPSAAAVNAGPSHDLTASGKRVRLRP
jgi:hypothetical protein